MFEDKYISIISKYLPKLFINYKGNDSYYAVEKQRNHFAQVIQVNFTNNKIYKHHEVWDLIHL